MVSAGMSLCLGKREVWVCLFLGEEKVLEF